MSESTSTSAQGGAAEGRRIEVDRIIAVLRRVASSKHIVRIDDAEPLFSAADVLDEYAVEAESLVDCRGLRWEAWSELDVDSDPSDPCVEHSTEWYVGVWTGEAPDPVARVHVGGSAGAERLARRLAGELNEGMPAPPLKAKPPALEGYVPATARDLASVETQIAREICRGEGDAKICPRLDQDGYACRECAAEAKRIREAVQGAAHLFIRTAASTPTEPASPVAAGWRMVPEEATGAMWQAAREADLHPGDSYSAVYDAMLAAAPAGPEGGDGWRPIREAKRDGTVYLLGFFEYADATQRWCVLEGYFKGGMMGGRWYDAVYHNPVRPSRFRDRLAPPASTQGEA